MRPAVVRLAFSAALILSGTVSSATPPLQIRNGTNDVLLSWAATAGSAYTIQVAASPAGPWATLTNLAAGSNALSWSDSYLDGVTRRFYRLLENQSQALPITNALLAVDGAALLLINPGFDLSDLAANAVFLASATNGTLTQGTSGWTYLSNPADRLVLQFTNGNTTTFFVSAISGNFTVDAENFLRSDHDLEFHAVTPRLFDLQIGSVVNTGTFLASASGSLTYSNVMYTVNLNGSGQHIFNTDTSGTELTEDFDLTGAISSSAFSLAVTQHHYFSLVSATHIATTAQDHLNSTLTVGPDSYQWVNVYKRKDFTDGIPVYYTPGLTPLYWTATGNVLKNGSAYGSYRYSDSLTDLYLRFFLDTPFGSIDLEDWER